MKRLLLLCTSLMSCFPLLAQTDSTSVEADTTTVPSEATVTVPATPKEKPEVFQASVNVDYGKLATTLVGWDEKYEAGLTMLFLDQYFIVGEYGMSVLSPENAFKNGEYTSEGTYYRVGGGYLRQINPKSRLGLGFLYASAQFDDRGAVMITSPTDTQDDYTNAFARSGLEARWMEMVITSENRLSLNKAAPDAAINRLFSLGFYLRARFLASYDRFELVDVYTIPGYGRSVNTPNLALNLFLKVYVF